MKYSIVPINVALNIPSCLSSTSTAFLLISTRTPASPSVTMPLCEYLPSTSSFPANVGINSDWAFPAQDFNLDEFIVTEGVENFTFQNVPLQDVPPQNVLHQGVPYQGVPHHGFPYQVVPQQTVPQQTVPQQAIPYQVVTQQVAPVQHVPQASASPTSERAAPSFDILKLLDPTNHEIDTNTRFTSGEQAHKAAMTRVDMNVSDPTVPTTTQQKCAIVKVMCEAMKSTERALDNPKAVQPFTEGKYSDVSIEAACWKVLESCIDRQTTGPLSPATGEKRKASSEMSSFAERISEIIESLIVS